MLIKPLGAIPKILQIIPISFYQLHTYEKEVMEK